MSSIPAFPLTPTERLAKTHALLCSVGFLVLLPVGALIARYGRNFTRQCVVPNNSLTQLVPLMCMMTCAFSWVNVHLVFQFLFAGPVIYAGCYKGHHTTSMLQFPHYQDTHQKVGLALLILYVCQAVLGLVIHFFKTPSLFGGHRPPQNYLHVTLGLSILVLAAYQVSWVSVQLTLVSLTRSYFRYTMAYTSNGCCWVDSTL